MAKLVLALLTSRAKPSIVSPHSDAKPQNGDIIFKVVRLQYGGICLRELLCLVGHDSAFDEKA
jgi:hypothetical protein